MSPQASGGADCNKSSYKYFEPKPATGKEEQHERIPVNTRSGVILPEPQFGAKGGGGGVVLLLVHQEYQLHKEI